MPRATIPTDRLDPHSLRLRRVYAIDSEPVSPDQIRAARRAYYGEISYVDDNLGRLIRSQSRSSSKARAKGST